MNTPDPPRRRAVTHAAPSTAVDQPAPASRPKRAKTAKRKPGPKAPGLKRSLAEMAPRPQGRSGAGFTNPDAPLNRQQLDFVAYYLADPARNGTAAARNAGYTAPGQAASRLLKFAAVQEEMARRLAPVVEELAVTAADVTRELARLGFSNVLDYGHIDARGQFQLDLSKTTRAQAAAVQEIKAHSRVRTIAGIDVTDTTTTLKLAPKREALVDLGRSMGMFAGDGSVAPVVVNFIVAGHPKAGTFNVVLEDEAHG